MARFKFGRPGRFGDAPEHREISRAFRRDIDARNQERSLKPYTLEAGPLDISATTTVIVGAKIGEGGFDAGELTLITDTTQPQDATDYWTFQLGFYRSHDGEQRYEELDDATIDTTEVALPAFKPVSVRVKRDLLPGDVVVVVVTKFNSAANLSGLKLEVAEIYEGA
jgi:hypothetical protein